MFLRGFLKAGTLSILPGEFLQNFGSWSPKKERYILITSVCYFLFAAPAPASSLNNHLIPGKRTEWPNLKIEIFLRRGSQRKKTANEKRGKCMKKLQREMLCEGESLTISPSAWHSVLTISGWWQCQIPISFNVLFWPHWYCMLLNKSKQSEGQDSSTMKYILKQ